MNNNPKLDFIDIDGVLFSEEEEDIAFNQKVCKDNNVFLLNLMASPGSGKTTLILKLLEKLKNKYRIGIIEADPEEKVDALKILNQGIDSVQLRTGNGCHLEAGMVRCALEKMNLALYDLVIIENIGNLVCPAEFTLGDDLQMMLLSVPEGDDKALKYPLMFSVVDALVVTKIDVLPYFDFNMQKLKENARRLNPELNIFALSSKTDEGVDDFILYLEKKIKEKQENK